MFFNLIKSQSIEPTQFPVKKVLAEVAKVLRITEERIVSVERYHYQLWVHIKGVGGKFVSYRRLPMWLDAAISAIKSCASLNSLEKLGLNFKFESKQYEKQYQKETIEALRVVWAKKRQELREREIYIAARIAYQNKAQKWLSGWKEVVDRCQNPEFLQSTMAEIQRQKKQFADLPNIVSAVEKIWNDRVEELIAIEVA